MKDVIKKFFKVSVISSCLFLLFGLFLIFQTENVIKTISIVIGSILILISLFPIIGYFKNRVVGILSSAGLLYGIFSFVAGMIIIVNRDFLATIIPTLAGIWMIINSVNKIQIAMELRDHKISSWLVTFIFALIILVGGVLFLCNPFGGAVMLGRTIGILIVIYSLFDIADSAFIFTKTKKVPKDKIIEAEVKEN